MKIPFFIFISLVLLSCNVEHPDVKPYTFSFVYDSVLNDSSEYIAVIGDIQEYMENDDYIDYYVSTVNWILSQHIVKKNINCILQVGDITNDGSKLQFEKFRNNTKYISEYIPFIACIGNHDYKWSSKYEIINRKNTLFSEYISFNKTNELIVARFEDGRMENIVLRNRIGGEDVYILVLEFGPRKEVVKWANDFVRKNRNVKFILLTHEYLTAKGERIDTDSYAEYQIKNTTISTPEELWQDLVKDNNNIMCVLCGHNGFSNVLLSENSSKRMVPQILFNLQYQKNGGDGLLQLWEFPENSDSVYIKIYNTVSHQWYTDDVVVDKFCFRYKY